MRRRLTVGAFTTVEMTVALLVSTVVLIALWAFVHGAGRFGSSSTTTVQTLGAIDRLETQMLKDLRQIARGAGGLCVLPGGSGLRMLVRDASDRTERPITYQVTNMGRLNRNGKSAVGLSFPRHRFEVLKGLVPGAPATVVIELDVVPLATGPEKDPPRVRTVRIVKTIATGGLAIG